jgi:hypothetical protein
MNLFGLQNCNYTNQKFNERAFVLVALVLACFAILPMAQAVVPAPDGGYPGENTAEGQNALFSLTTGAFNTAVGWLSLRSNTEGDFNTGVGAGALFFNTGNENTATGVGALLSNTTGTGNTANGALALFSNTTGGFNTANGINALFNNTAGIENTANGFEALFSNTDGDHNTANGAQALLINTSGEGNTATGYQALLSNTTGGFNTAVGMQALFSNLDGGGNTAVGSQALSSNASGFSNTAVGTRALFSNDTGDENTAVGIGALSLNIDGFQNTAIGDQSLLSNTTGINNTAIGHFALGNTTGQGNIGVGAFAGQNLTTGDFNIDIFNVGVAGESNTIRIGSATQTATYIAGISGAVVPGGVTVIVDAAGHLGTVVSSQRFKDRIEPMDKASEAILALKPVTFRYKHELDPKGIQQFGLVAEEVDKVNPDLVVRDKEGKPYSVRYEQVNAMLLNEFLKEHRKVEQLTKDFESKLAEQQKQIEALTVGLQKVSDQLELSKPAPHVAVKQ